MSHPLETRRYTELVSKMSYALSLLCTYLEKKIDQIDKEEKVSNDSTTYEVKIKTDNCVEEREFDNIELVKDFVFNIFTDFDINEDTIDDIDSHIRELSSGYIIIKNKNNKAR